MADDPAKFLTNRRWIHSHEEDTDSHMVFRSPSYDFPRSRGRSGFELRPDQSMVDIQPGAADRPEETDGTWKLKSENLLFFKPGSDRPSRSLKIVSADNDKLVVAKPA
ncbi:MAG TPA: hypothetical protein VKS98_10140 [Chthoniobacterales bacterium]|nr:hypothetical protein [Chthoniobacterales bacterium]